MDACSVLKSSAYNYKSYKCSFRNFIRTIIKKNVFHKLLNKGTKNNSYWICSHFHLAIFISSLLKLPFKMTGVCKGNVIFWSGPAMATGGELLSGFTNKWTSVVEVWSAVSVTFRINL